MSGYIGTTPKKIRRGFIEIPNENEIINYAETEDTSFSTDPIKEYYELIDGEYVLTDDVSMDPEKTYYEYHPHYGKIQKVIKKAWIGNQVNEPELALCANNYIYDQSPLVPYTGNYKIIVNYNGHLHMLGGNSSGTASISDKAHYYLNDNNEWEFIEYLPFSIRNSTGYAVSYGNKLYALYDILDSSNNVLSSHMYSWDGTSWTEESTPPVSITGLISGSAIPVYLARGHFVSSGNQGISIIFPEYDSGTTYARYYIYDGTQWGSKKTLKAFGANYIMQDILQDGNYLYVFAISSGTRGSSSNKYSSTNMDIYLWNSSSSSFSHIKAVLLYSINGGNIPTQALITGNKYESVMYNNCIYCLYGLLTTNYSGAKRSYSYKKINLDTDELINIFDVPYEEYQNFDTKARVAYHDEYINCYGSSTIITKININNLFD